MVKGQKWSKTRSSGRRDDFDHLMVKVQMVKVGSDAEATGRRCRATAVIFFLILLMHDAYPAFSNNSDVIMKTVML